MRAEINVLGVSLKTFGIFFALNFVAWGALVARRLREMGKPVDWAYEMVFWALVGGLVGARGYYLLQNHRSLSLGDVFGGSGLIWYGGLAGGVVTILLWARRRGFLSLALLDLAGPGLALGYAIGPRRGTARGRWATRTARCRRRPARPSIPRRSTRRCPWASSPGCSGSCATASGPGSSSPSTSCSRAPSASSSSSCAATATSPSG
ncbi:MAG: prolipoprotein diacylglyceryl transferase [Actinobacteria bacterium]|nr:MAG: prolipoprotein diacylglyceryl transferase [Actinomycetota bacterium]